MDILDPIRYEFTNGETWIMYWIFTKGLDTEHFNTVAEAMAILKQIHETLKQEGKEIYKKIQEDNPFYDFSEDIDHWLPDWDNNEVDWKQIKDKIVPIFLKRTLH